jgi:hypothetical protein
MFERKIGDTDNAADIEVETNPLTSITETVAIIEDHFVLYVFMTGMLVVLVTPADLPTPSAAGHPPAKLFVERELRRAPTTPSKCVALGYRLWAFELQSISPPTEWWRVFRWRRE